MFYKKGEEERRGGERERERREGEREGEGWRERGGEVRVWGFASSNAALGICISRSLNSIP